MFVAQIASRFFANDVGMRLALLGAGTLLVALAVIVARLRTPLDNR